MRTTTLEKRSYIDVLQGNAMRKQEQYIYDIKNRIWNEYDKEEISSSVLASIISDVERAVLVGYQLGQKHGNELGREKGFTEALKTLFDKENGNDKNESAA
jgi:hypothetical protein